LNSGFVGSPSTAPLGVGKARRFVGVVIYGQVRVIGERAFQPGMRMSAML
jgi:hypothetical protein